MQQNATNWYEECREEVTRAQLLSLRTAGNLELDCSYAVTDYNRRGCLDWRVEYIEMIADSVDVLSMDVRVKTDIDNVSWEWRYDIDTNRIVELKDNRWNHAQWSVWNEVDLFPWGNTLWNEVKVLSADVNVSCETLLRVTNTRFETDSSTNLLDATGRIDNSLFSENATTNMSNGSIAVSNSKFTTNANVNWAGSTIDIDDSEFSTSANVDGINSTWVRYLDSTVSNNWQDQYNNSTNAQRLYTIIDGGYVYFTGGTRNYLYQTKLNPRGTIRQIDWDMLVYYSQLDSYAEIRNEAGSALFQIYYSHYTSRAYIRNYNTNTVRHYGVDVWGRWEIQHTDAALHTLYYNDISSYARLVVSWTTTVVYALNASSYSRVNFSAGTHYYCHFSTYFVFNSAFNSRSVYGHGRITQTATAANSSKWRDYFNNSII